MASRSTRTASAAAPSSCSRIRASGSRNWRRSGRALPSCSPKIAEQLETDALYDVYLSRQAADIAAYRRDESLELPEALDYTRLPGLSNEARQRLQAVRPRTIGQAGRIDGMTPAALTLLVAHLKRKGRGRAAKSASGGSR